MTAEKTNLQKLENLLNSATSERQRKMYLALLNKARAEYARPSASQQQKATETSTSTNKKVRGKTAKTKAESNPPASKKTSSKNSATSFEKVPSNSVVVTEEVSITDKSTPVEQTNQTKQNKDNGTTKAKAKQKSKQSKNNDLAASEDTNNKPYFSAVGVIRCTPYLEGEKIFVTIDGQQYELQKVVKGASHKRFRLLKEELEENGSREMMLRVYPNITHFKDGSPPHQLFRLVQFYLDGEQYSELPEEFVFHGIWRVISVCPNPVITINRNIRQLGDYKSLSEGAKKYFAKSQDFPVVWDAPVEPFKYDSRRKKSEQMPRYFVQVKAIFKNGQYVVTEMLNPPTLKIPRFIMLPKKKS